MFLFGLLKGSSSLPAELLDGADRTWGWLAMQIMQKLSAQALKTCVTGEGHFQGLSKHEISTCPYCLEEGDFFFFPVVDRLLGPAFWLQESFPSFHPPVVLV